MDPPALLRLPDELLARVYGHLLRRPPGGDGALRGRALHAGARDAFALALTCRRLLRLFAAAALRDLAPHAHPPPPPGGPRRAGRSAYLTVDGAGAAAAAAAAAAATVAAAAAAAAHAGGNGVEAADAVAAVAAWRAAERQRARARAHVAQPPASAELHVCAMVRLAAASLRTLTLDAHPPDRACAYRSFLPAPPVHHYGDRAAQMDPHLVLAAVADRLRGDCGGGGGKDEGLQALRLVHPRPLYSQGAAIALWRVLCQSHGSGMRTLEVRDAETHMARAMAMAALAATPDADADPGSEVDAFELAGRTGGSHEDDPAWLNWWHSWRMPARGVDLPPSAVPLRELRLPAFSAGWEALCALIETFGPTLTTLEFSVLREEVVNLGDSPRPPLESATEASRYFSRIAARCPGLEVLHLGELIAAARPLGLAIVQGSPRLRSLSLDGISGELSDPHCFALALIRAADAHCLHLTEIHMIDCLVLGESSELFNAVGSRLRTFTGLFSWETAEELTTFADACPNVESLSLRCGEGNPGVPCDDGAVHACIRFGSNLRSLIICNMHIAEASFMTAVCAATGLRELELVCDPKLSPARMLEVLHAVGSGLRALTIAWRSARFQQPVDGVADSQLLDAIAEHCPLLESLCIPELWYDADFASTPSRLIEAIETMDRLKSRLVYLDVTDCNIDKHVKRQLQLNEQMANAQGD